MGRKEKKVSTEQNAIGARMRLARQEKNISLSKMAQLIRYTKGRLSSVENGHGQPSLELIRAYEEALGMRSGTLSRDERSPDNMRKEQSVKSDQFEPLVVQAKKEANAPEVGNKPARSFVEYADEAPRLHTFYGRESELIELRKWLVHDRCRVVTLLGIGGIGKTVLATRLKEEVKSQFAFVYWRTLQNALPPDEYLNDCIRFLAGEERVELPKGFSERIRLLGKYLQNHRCLLVLDNIETILKGGLQLGATSLEQGHGSYQAGYEGYGELFHFVGSNSSLQSCVLLTSRELPVEVEALEGNEVRVWHLSGIGLEEGRLILQERNLIGTEEEFNELVQMYSGNPLALKLAAGPISELFGGEIAEFLAERGAVIGDIYDLIDGQFHRLSAQERELIYWFALACEPVSLKDISRDIVRPVPKRLLLSALDSLRHRSMIESSSGARFTLQPVIMEYVTDVLVSKVCQEIENGEFEILASHALIKAQAKDHIRNNQVRLFLEPVIKLLLTSFGKIECERKLRNMLAYLREKRPQTPEYAAGNILNLLIQLKVDLTGYDFSNLCVRNAYLRDSYLQKVDFSYAQLENCVFTDTFGSILSIALGADETLTVAGTANGEVRLWHTHSGAPLGVCHGHEDWVRSVDISPDGTVALSGSDDQALRLWDTRTTQCLRILHGHENRIRSVVFLPDGKQALSAGDDMTIRLWNVYTGDCLKTLRGHTSRVWCVTRSTDGRLAASASSDYTVRLWDIESGECIHVFQGHKGRVNSVAFSPDGRLLASGGEDQVVRIWDIESGEMLRVFTGHTGRIWPVKFSPDGRMVASGSDDRSIRIWSIESGECVHTLHGHLNRVWSIVYSASGNSLVSGSDDQTIRMWNTGDGLCFKTLQGHSSRIRAVSFSSDGTKLISGSDDRSVRIWDVETGRNLRTLQGHSTWIYTVAYSPKGNLLASGSDDQTIRIWDPRTGYCIRTLAGHTNWVRSVAFNQDGSLLVSGSDDQTMRLWQVETGLCLGIVQQGLSRIWSVAFAPGSDLVAAGGEDTVVRVWKLDIPDYHCLFEMHGHTKRVRSVSFSPDGTLLASCSDDRTIRIWSVATGECIRVLRGHTLWIWSVAFSPDSRYIASGGDDNSVRLWDWKENQQIWASFEHARRIYSISYSPFGDMIASGSYDGTIKLWDVKTGNCLRSLQSERPYENMIIKGITGLSSAQKAMLRTLGAVEE